MFSAIKGLWINFLNVFKGQAKETVNQSEEVVAKKAQEKIAEVTDMLNQASSKLDKQ